MFAQSFPPKKKSFNSLACHHSIALKHETYSHCYSKSSLSYSRLRGMASSDRLLSTGSSLCQDITNNSVCERKVREGKKKDGTVNSLQGHKGPMKSQMQGNTLGWCDSWTLLSQSIFGLNLGDSQQKTDQLWTTWGQRNCWNGDLSSKPTRVFGRTCKSSD